jgi:hypothetical protein
MARTGTHDIRAATRESERKFGTLAELDFPLIYRRLSEMWAEQARLELTDDDVLEICRQAEEEDARERRDERRGHGP